MKCHYCGAEVNEKEVFCCNCGTRQIRREEPAASAVPVCKAAPEEMEYVRLLDMPAQQRWEPAYRPAPPAASEERPAYVPYGAPENSRKSPLIQLPTERSLVKMFFLGILTLGIYPLVIWCRIVLELNIAASRYDGERTISYLGSWLLAPITLCIYPFVWIHGFCRRIGAELNRRCIDYHFGASTFWLWNVLGSLILVGPFVFLHKLMKAMNLINGDFNING